MMAAARGRSAQLRLLLQAGAKVDARDNDGSTALLLAARAGRQRCAQLLLQAGADANAANRLGWTPLMEVAGLPLPPAAKRVALLLLLLEGGADPARRSPAAGTALIQAARSGHRPSVVALLRPAPDRRSSPGRPLSGRQRAGVTPSRVGAPRGRADPVPRTCRTT
jgi:ankyrin repeat protein